MPVAFSRSARRALFRDGASRGAFFATVAGVAIALGGCGEPAVVRVVDGRPEVGRFISDRAYALFARGAEAEMAGDLDAARRLFEQAAREDSESPEIWTRIGALRCREAAHDAAANGPASAAFARAEAVDASFAPLYRERARCMLAEGQGMAAVAEADRALGLDPDDLETTLVRAEALERTGRADEAVRALRAAAVRRPALVAPCQALLDLARRRGDAALAREAGQRIAALSPESAGLRDLLAGIASLADLDAALGARDLARARRLALKLRLPGAEVALRAAALGLASLAQEQAALVLGADPSDASARIALAAAADLQGDLPGVAAALQAIPPRSTAPSPLARLLFAEVLRRRAGAEAARAWLGALRQSQHPEPGGDALLAATDKRVWAELATP